MTFTSAISGIIVSVTSCGKQGNMSRMTLSDRIEIEAGIYARRSLSEIAERIHKGFPTIYVGKRRMIVMRDKFIAWLDEQAS